MRLQALAVVVLCAGSAAAQAPPQDQSAATQAAAARASADRLSGGTRNAGGRPVHNEAERLAEWKTVRMPYASAGLTPSEREVVAKLADALRLLDEIYWQQSDKGGHEMFLHTRSPELKRLFAVYGSRWDLVDGNAPFVGEAWMPPGRELYPVGTAPSEALTARQIEAYVAAHPDAKAAIYDEHTVLTGTPGKLEAVPYHVAYARWLIPMAKDLRDAAALTKDAAFANYLRLRADALLSDDYYASDLAWLDMKSPKIDLLLAPYETYLDGVLGVKTSYGGSLLIRDDVESRKLTVYQKNEAAMQQALPIAAEFKPAKDGQATPMEVADAPLRAGDLRYGYQAVADNLPNDPRVHEKKGSKKIFFRNFMDARVNDVVLPMASRIMAAEDVKAVSGKGYLTAVILHEVSHALGPVYATVGGRQVDIREAIGAAYGGLEEAKADVTGVFLAKWLNDQKLISDAELREVYASYVAGIFRTLRFGTAESHGKAQLMEFDYLSERGAVISGADGKFNIEFAKMPDAITDLARTLLMFEAKGDRASVSAWYAKYGVVPDALQSALAKTTDIPVDVTPEFALDKAQGTTGGVR